MTDDQLEKALAKILSEHAPEVLGIAKAALVDDLSRVLEIHTLEEQIKTLQSLRLFQNFSADTNGRFRLQLAAATGDLKQKLEDLTNEV
jgi:hypothetical protein